MIPLSIQTQEHTYTINNSVVSISLIGEGASALTCHTELTTCCREQDYNGTALGEWIGPDSSQIPESGRSSGFYVLREQSSISLNIRKSSNQPGGTYCCVVPRVSGMTRTFCVVISVSGVCVCGEHIHMSSIACQIECMFFFLMQWLL